VAAGGTAGEPVELEAGIFDRDLQRKKGVGRFVLET
jgi:hypothetical protein